MKKAIFAGCVALAVVLGACNNVGTCPAASTITPGGSCSGDSLECPYTLQSPSAACDGTDIEGGLATSCVCTKGSWVCPSPVSCESGSGEAGEGDSGESDAAKD
jgi:hypothetical protein